MARDRRLVCERGVEEPDIGSMSGKDEKQKDAERKGFATTDRGGQAGVGRGRQPDNNRGGPCRK
ncbi:hypothetical protein GGTG_01366 [Gaeumannomyces tritici R3-111a-1]|uniref:Uncharacterized protein n=1 Tax=Gaeumannomyces tritici (strain R3-111a-1) TaxID=644352 RepID=J3NJD4_GAET3|nr:hypothetical protein GGTG_01366 [Gaeumannomyces tritici R3-111a-1]EJT81385.1 hypothetical protein GGTG_01366 [Gaeumannomyces tritici R3-111a-1]